ncbi:MAG: prephenate dehydrogenase [Saprospiraceae bacterium]|jgi:prephenate dehydrogenase
MSYSSNPFSIDRLALVGVGLIGGSLVQALKQHSAVKTVIGVDQNAKNLQQALDLRTIDEATNDIAAAVNAADIVVLATPVMTIERVLESIKPHLNAKTTITDVGSVKGLVVDQAKHILGNQFPQFVPGHPIAGSENSGVLAAFPSLFEDHRVILTPTEETSVKAVEVTSNMWAATGAQVELMPVEQHDKILAVTSHLPHVLAYALMQFLNQQPDQQTYFRLAAGGLYDFTRIASSDPVMWRDICIGNKQHLSEQLRAFSKDLERFADLIEAEQSQPLEASFTAAKEARTQVASFRKYHKKRV